MSRRKNPFSLGRIFITIVVSTVLLWLGWLVFLSRKTWPREKLAVVCGNGNISDKSGYPPLPQPGVHFLLVHAGANQPPDHIYDCISHTRRLNPTRTVLVVTDQLLENVYRLERDSEESKGSLTFVSTATEFATWRASLAGSATPGVVNVLIGAVPCTSSHMAMRRVERSNVDDGSSIPDGFWYNTLARLYYAYDVINAGGFHEIIHFEV